jgi:hypothetical protein
MEPDKSLQDALLRSHLATDEANQDQHQLHHMAAGSGEKHIAKPQPELHETPHNLLKSWDTLRKMDEELARKEANAASKTQKPDNKSGK